MSALALNDGAGNEAGELGFNFFRKASAWLFSIALICRNTLATVVSGSASASFLYKKQASTSVCRFLFERLFIIYVLVFNKSLNFFEGFIERELAIKMKICC